MSALDGFILKVKRGEGPFYGFLKSAARMVMRPQAPLLPRAVKPFFRVLYELHYLTIQTTRMLLNVCYRHPLLQARCASFGRNVSIDGLPFITGHLEVHIGNNVWLGGRIDIMTARFLENPRLIIKDNAQVSWNVRMTVNREVVIEENARVSFDVRISDSDGHPREADLRRQDAPVNPKDIRPVRICRDAWIGNGAHIMKGVTIGEGAIVGANSVVITDVPPYSLALGNPAEVYFKNYGRPSDFRKKPVAESAPMMPPV
jgi:acetyltransferase-like isoleucine patch superfamily enzyme